MIFIESIFRLTNTYDNRILTPGAKIVKKIFILLLTDFSKKRFDAIFKEVIGNETTNQGFMAVGVYAGAGFKLGRRANTKQWQKGSLLCNRRRKSFNSSQRV